MPTRTVMTFALLVCVARAQAATFYVAVHGNDGSPGTASQPYRSVGRGVGVLQPGDVLLVGPGVYAESLYGNIPSGTSWSNPVAVRAWDPLQRPVLRPGAGSFRVLHFQGQQYIEIAGLVLDGVHVDWDVVKVTVGGGAAPAHHIRIRDCEIMNARNSGNRQQGILVTDGATDNEFLNNDIHDNGADDFAHGIYIATHNNQVIGNRVHRNAGWGVHAYGPSGEVHGNTIANNFIHDNAAAGARGDGIILSSGSGNRAVNNVIWNNNCGIAVDIGAEDSEVLHNTIVGNRSCGLEVWDSVGAVVRNNIIVDNSVHWGGANTVVDHNLVGRDPGFVSRSGLDFRLAPGSVAIDAGVALGGVDGDVVGATRVSGAGPDLGAYEFMGDAPAAAPMAPTEFRVLAP